MNIKAYIDQFSEISHLQREQQFLLLEKACTEACAELKFLNFSTIAFLVRAMFLLVLSGGSFFLFGYSVWLAIVTVFFSLIFSSVAITEINSHLMSKSLKTVLNKESL